MPFDAPFTLGPFSVDGAGRLAPLADGSLPHFRLQWRGRNVDITFTGQLPAIQLAVNLGRVPSTAQPMGALSPVLREKVFATLRDLPPCLPAGWRAELQADHRVVLHTHTDIAMPARATDVLAEIVTFLLKVAPYLDLLDEDGLGVDGSACRAASCEPKSLGTAMTCPG